MSTIFSSIKEKKITRYNNSIYQTKVTVTDVEIIAGIKATEKFKLLLILEKIFTLRTDCQAIVASYNKKSDSELSDNRWLKFVDYIIGNGFKVTVEHIKGKITF